jgi:hypothetical protein
LENKFIKQAGSNLVDLHPIAEPLEQRGFSLYSIGSRLEEWGVQLVPYMVTYYFIDHFNLWGEETFLWSHPR